MQSSEYNLFSSINGDGVTVADTFNSWRKSTNGIIQKLTVEAGSPTWDTTGKVVIGAAVTNGNAATVDIGVARTGSGDATINLGSVAGSNNVVISRASGANGAFSITNNGTGLFTISQAGVADLRLLTSATERVRILADGKVGIGTITPTELLHVNGGNFKVSGNIIGGGTINSGAITSSGTIGGTNITASGFLNASTLGVGTSNTAFTVAADGIVTAKRLLIGDGTLAAPSITFSTDASTDTGFNHTTDGAIDVVCNAQSVGTFTSAGFGGLSAKASTLSNGGGGGNAMQFNYAGQGGQPLYVWGSDDTSIGSQNYVWNPANFSVAYATNANGANYASNAGNAYACSGLSSRAGNGPDGGTFYCSHTVQATKLHVAGFNPSAAGIVCVADNANNNNVGPAIQFYAYTSAFRGSINVRSDGTNYTSSSDYRLKTDYAPIQNAVDRVNTLNPLNFKWIESGSRNDGFLAHEVAEVVPNAVSGIKDAVDDDGNPIIQSIDMSKLIPLLTAAIQELSARVTALESAQL